MVVHEFELLSELNSLVERLLFFLYTSFDLLSSSFDCLLELCEVMFVSIELHILLCFHKSGDEL